MPVRWVFVHDAKGTREDGHFYRTGPPFSPSRVVTLYTGRWSVEVTFQGARQHLGFHTPRGWTRRSVLRTAPCLLSNWPKVLRCQIALSIQQSVVS